MKTPILPGISEKVWKKLYTGYEWNVDIHALPQLHKFSDLYAAYGLGAVKNIWLITLPNPFDSNGQPQQNEGLWGYSPFFR